MTTRVEWRPIAEAPRDGSVVITDAGALTWQNEVRWANEGWIDGDGDYRDPHFFLTGIPPVPEG